MTIETDHWDNNKIYGIESDDPEIGARLDYIKRGNGKYAIQSGPAQIGSILGVNGGMAPTAVLPGCNKEFWTAKLAYKHTTVTSKNQVTGDNLGEDQVTDSSIQLLHMSLDGSVLENVDLELPIYSVIANLLVRTDSYERVPVAQYWVNPYFYDRFAHWESGVTTASPDYFTIPRSYLTKSVQYIAGDRNTAASYIRPASYAGPLGPVYSGVTAVTDITISPWSAWMSPVEPSNINIRDIKLDANDNLWVILQIGWEYCRTYLSKQAYGLYYYQEISTWIGYESSYTSPQPRYFYSSSAFPRLYNPSGDYYRAGPIQPRVVILVFDKKTSYKTWDYVPFRPGTRGFNRLARESNPRGPALYGITQPPTKLDADPYGNIYYSVGTADLWEYAQSSSNLQCYGIAKNEIGYLYVKPAVNKAYTIKTGLDVGRIGPYPSQCTFMAYDQNTMAYYNKIIGNTSYPSFRAPWTWTIGGGRTAVTRYKSADSNGIETWYASTFGNATTFRSTFLINSLAVFPHPYVTTSAYWGPCEVRPPQIEWLTSTENLMYQNRDTDLLFAGCDFLTRNYTCLTSPAAYHCASWWKHETSWTPGLTSYPQMHPQKDVWFEVGSGDTEPYSGWKPAEAPGFWYTHFNVKNNIMYEMEVRSYALKDTRTDIGGKGFLPLYGGTVYNQDAIYRVASTPYAQIGVASGTEYWQPHGVMGMLPTIKTRVANEDLIIIPVYDWKHEIFAFTGLTWDSYGAIRTKFGPTYTTSVASPWRFHSYKLYLEQASYDKIDPLAYGLRAAYLDPASRVISGEYHSPEDDKVFYYDSTFKAMEADVKSKWDRQEVRDAYNGIFPYIAQAKWHYFENGLTNLNFGVFTSAISCENSVGFFIPRYKIGATIEDVGDYYINIITDTRPLKRLYIVKVGETGDLTWKKEGVKKTKSWWAKKSTWKNGIPDEKVESVLGIKYYDFMGGEIATLKKWDTATTIERYQQLCFINWWPKNKGREPPQMY